MMTKKYKIAGFTLEINSPVDFQDVEPFSLFAFDGGAVDYTITIELSDQLPTTIEAPFFASTDKVCIYVKGNLKCYYKSRSSASGYYACRKTDGKSIIITFDKKYGDMLRAEVIFSVLGIEELVAQNNGCIIHSSFIEKNGGAVLFTGPCSIGKSTQADLWREFADATVINGDKAIIYENNGDIYACGLPFSGSSKDCLNKLLPLKAIICLQKGAENTACRLTSDAFLSIYRNCYPVPYSRELTGTLFDFTYKVSQQVPVYEYSCRADEGAVRYLERILCLI
jgi:hypothetical protein